jgi:hypothetical protein
METDLPFLERVRLIQRMVRLRVAADLLVYTPYEWNEVRPTHSFVLAEIAQKGRVVYDDPAQPWLESGSGIARPVDISRPYPGMIEICG